MREFILVLQGKNDLRGMCDGCLRRFTDDQTILYAPGYQFCGTDCFRRFIEQQCCLSFDEVDLQLARIFYRPQPTPRKRSRRQRFFQDILGV